MLVVTGARVVLLNISIVEQKLGLQVILCLVSHWNGSDNN